MNIVLPENDSSIEDSLRGDGAIEQIRGALKKNPKNINAMHQLAVLYWKEHKNLQDAEALLRRATHIDDAFTGAWLTLGALLMETSKYLEAIDAYSKATELEPKNAKGWSGLGSAYGLATYPEKAVWAFEKAIALDGGLPGTLSAYARELKTIGDQPAALKAYRRAVAAKPNYGPAYWSMANLRNFNFTDEEIKQMRRQVEGGEQTEVDDIHIRFALGKAMEGKKNYAAAWHYYHSGNEKHRMTVEHEPLEMEKRLTAIKNVFNAELLQSRAGVGYDLPGPIFIVGFPCSGSTLIELILASHSQIEGSSEQPLLLGIAESVGRYRTDRVAYPEAVRGLRDKDLRAYGKQYIDECRRQRITDKPFFTDKLPDNFSSIGFAHLILPNAKIINTRRHPFDSCLAAYKQLFRHGQNFTYDMLELAHYYQQYDAMMKHWHTVLPDKILDVHIEETVTDIEGQVRRVLEFCGLPFEEGCLNINETEHASQPTYKDSLGEWRHYEEYLEFWRLQLGDIKD